MDRDAFDGLAKLLASSPNRRAALGALLGIGLAGTAAVAEAAKKERGKKRRNDKKGRGSAGQVAAQAADCLSPGPSSNMNGCPFQGSDFSDDDLSGSSMVGTNFSVSALVGTDLSSSNMRNASFRGANLTCADLSSSTLRNADFRGFPALGPNAGPPTDLTGADLSSSGGCGTTLTNGRTILCGTTWCDGTVRNDDCLGGVDRDALCCAQGCDADQHCARTGGCACDAGFSPCQTGSGLTCSAGACCLDRRDACCDSGIIDFRGDCCCPGSTPGEIACATGYQTVAC